VPLPVIVLVVTLVVPYNKGLEAEVENKVAALNVFLPVIISDVESVTKSFAGNKELTPTKHSLIVDIAEDVPAE